MCVCVYRVLVSSNGELYLIVQWWTLFDRADVVHLSSSKLDHAPILHRLVFYHERAPRHFMVLETWTRDLSCEMVINNAWDAAGRCGRRLSSVAKLQWTARALKLWNRQSFSSCQTRSKEIETKIAYIQSLDPTEMNISLEKALRKELLEWQYRLEVLWR